MTVFYAPPLEPLAISLDLARATLSPEGPTLVRRMADLEGLFADDAAWKAAADGENPVVYTVTSSPVPEIDRELPQSITIISPGDLGGEFYMTKGHQHPNRQGEIYLGIHGVGGLLMFDGTQERWLDMAPGIMGYIPPGWAHRSINVGDNPYSFLAVYPGGAGHDYGWVLEHGMGKRAYRAPDIGVSLRDYYSAVN
jgi:glucose-6-phosphate isomerase